MENDGEHRGIECMNKWRGYRKVTNDRKKERQKERKKERKKKKKKERKKERMKKKKE